jgi:hypothetical protein
LVREALEPPAAPGLRADAQREWAEALRTAVLKRRVRGADSQLVQMVRRPEVIDAGVKERIAADVSAQGKSRLKVGGKILPWSTITETWDEANGRLTVVGEPGYGKTVAALTLLKHINERADDQWPVAELFPLVEWYRWREHSRGDLAEWLAAQLAASYGLQVAVAADLVDAELVVPILDGLDEVPAADRQACKEAIESYAGRAAPFRAFILTCRMREYGDLAPDLVAVDRQVALIGLDQAQIVQELDGKPQWDDVRARLMAGDTHLLALFRSPLRLATALVAYQARSPNELIDIETPAAQAHLWDLTLGLDETAFGSHGAPAVRQWLEFLAEQMVRASRQRLWLHELHRFPMDSDAEYGRFVARVGIAIAVLFSLLGLLVIQMFVGLSSWLAWIILGTNTVNVMFGVRGLLLRHQPIPSVGSGIPLPARVWHGGLATAPEMAGKLFGVATLVAVLEWAIIGVIEGFDTELLVTLAVTYGLMALVALIAIQFARAVKLGTTEVLFEPPRQLVGRGPMAALMATRKRAVAVGLSWGLLTLAVGSALNVAAQRVDLLGAPWSTIVGLAAVVALGAAVYEGLPWLYYQWLRRRLAKQGVVPLQLRQFLDWCAEPARGWLRASDAYEFRHRELLEYLAQATQCRAGLRKRWLGDRARLGQPCGGQVGSQCNQVSSHARTSRSATSDTAKASQADTADSVKSESARRRSGPSPQRRTSPTAAIRTASVYPQPGSRAGSVSALSRQR